jgi:FAD/FMN-containing dehydrogenase
MLRGIRQAQELDLARMLVGSEGTLGLFTEATLFTMPLPSFRAAACLMFKIAGTGGSGNATSSAAGAQRLRSAGSPSTEPGTRHGSAFSRHDSAGSRSGIDY